MEKEPPKPCYTIAVISAPDEAHTRPMLPIVRELRRRDHRITYITTMEFAERAATAGVDVLVPESRPEYGPYGEARDPAAALDLSSVEETLDCAEEIHAEFADDVPDLVLYESSTRVVARLLTCRWNRPGVQVYPSFAWDDGRGPDAPVPEGRSSEECLARLPDGLRRRLARFLAYAEHAGAPPQDFYTRAEPLSIALMPRAFQSGGDRFDSRVAFVGPCIPERRIDERWMPAGDGLPVVFLALDPALLHRDPGYLRECATALARLPLHLVVTTGGADDRGRDQGGLPPNVEVHARVPRSVVLRRASAYICHPDAGNVMEALYFNTPLVAVPTTASERVVADRVAELGLGVRLPPEAAAPERLVEAVHTLLDDADTLHRVRGLQREARRAGGARRAADEIERYLEWIYEP
ncbi:macrolide family glycosyltransferase [Streptomyces sp. NPDC021100]|uniref:macrolide family glycosyltransferase n=1 Tax=Streptomyces sp. NPDC021100 TaxID=3365114 RepID=UPI0037B7DE05